MSLKLALSAAAIALAAAPAHAQPLTPNDVLQSLKGSYDVKLVIGAKTFHDDLLITNVATRPGTMLADIQGFYNVPGSFMSALSSASVAIEPGCGSFQYRDDAIDFTITANEGGKAYLVHVATEGRDGVFEGQATLDDGKVIGDVTLTQKMSAEGK